MHPVDSGRFLALQVLAIVIIILLSADIVRFRVAERRRRRRP